MALTPDDLSRIAALARLEPPALEDDPVVRDLERMLELVGELPESTGQAPPAGQPAWPVGRELEGTGDDPAGLARDLVLANAPVVRGDLISVPAVLEHPTPSEGDPSERP